MNVCIMNEEQIQAIELLSKERSFDNLWHALEVFEGYVFHTAKGLEYSYIIKGGEMFVDRKEKSITKSSVERAYQRALLGGITGPKKLGVFGASYLYPVFACLKII